ncbi:hypothetical protein [Alkalihalobacterium chitinilyticum]|uniref:DUF4279 domain-containing protein n=1 Tax=Alkalihalobacterium chitinilyticum TaxID=2980103 RepID=A0ABT5VHT3_9BACI|nr:hypothetical protein [Alkalihalobacterium chitinilyticum]MDE5414810.1 hypothetical protein [Alkalihalobacterium chitinilyticum]
MWKIVPICEDIFGFWAGPNGNDAWTATMIIKEKNYSIEIIAEIHISYLNDMAEVENLLEEIREFSHFIKRQKDKAYGVIHFTCKGISTFKNSKPLQTYTHSSGLTLIDTEFTEEMNESFLSLSN